MVSTRHLLVGLAAISSALAAIPYPPHKVRNAGVPVGQLKNVSGSKYHSDM